jgi:hypothetical protein
MTVPGPEYSISGLPRTMFLVRQVWAIWFIMRRWVWDTDMPGALVVDEVGHGMTFTLVAAAMICKLLIEKVVIVLPLSITLGNTLEEWLILVHTDCTGIVGEDWEWYPLQRMNSVHHHLLEIQTTPPHEHRALLSVLEPILGVRMTRVAETFMTVIKEMKN